jgi:hypothetical protein
MLAEAWEIGFRSTTVSGGNSAPKSVITSLVGFAGSSFPLSVVKSAPM